MKPEIKDLGEGVYLIDLEERGAKGWTAGYLVDGSDSWLLIETGPAASADLISAAMRELAVKDRDLQLIAVTHIHLDHAGGAGTLARRFPKARVLAHPRAFKHLIDPSRLVAGTRKVRGEKAVAEFGKVEPLPEDRLFPVNEGQVLTFGTRSIQVWETSGHTNQHICYYDPRSKGVFSGDAAGVFHPALSSLLGRPIIRPALSAPEFSMELMLDSITRLALENVETIYYTHFGPASPAKQLLEITLGQVLTFVGLGRRTQSDAGEPVESMPTITRALIRLLRKYTLQGLCFSSLDESQPLEKIINLPAQVQTSDQNLMAQAENELAHIEMMLEVTANGILEYLRISKGGNI